MPTRQHVYLSMSDGVRLAASLYVPDGDGPVARRARGAPLPQGRRHRRRTGPSTSGSRPPATWCAASTCAAPDRPEGIAEDEYPADRTHRPDDGDRLARHAGVVDRQRRHVRHELLRIQLDPARDRTSAGAEGDHPHLRHRRPLRRRRPLHGRRGEAARPGRLPVLHDRVERAAARPGASTARAGARSGSGACAAASRGS